MAVRSIDSMKASSLALSPVNSIVYARSLTSMILPRKMSAVTFCFLTFLADGTDLDHHHFAFDEITVRQIDDIDDFDQTVQMFGNLFDHIIRTDGDDRHAGQGRIFGRLQRSGFRCCNHEQRKVRQHEPVRLLRFPEVQKLCVACYLSSRLITISVNPLPALTIGQTFSVESVRMFRKTSLSFIEKASLRAPSTSTAFSTLMPT